MRLSFDGLGHPRVIGIHIAPIVVVHCTTINSTLLRLLAIIKHTQLRGLLLITSIAGAYL